MGGTRRAALLLTAGLAALPDAGVPNRGPGPRQHEAIVWSETRRLTWDDFRARPIRELDGARSALNYRTRVGCRNQRLHFRILAVFLPAQSSVTYRIISSGLASRVGLAHEQLHFDLAEVYARRIRRMYAELPDPCPRSDEALEALADPLFREAADAQRRYDDYTRFGESEARQLEWGKRIAADLAELKAWADDESVF